ncbi:MAG: glycosyltransferase, partial [Planctomycetota bacterium]
LDQLNRLADRQGVADRTHFLGMVRGDAKWALYRAADVFVLPTQQENFGLVLVEAMGSGLPVLTTTGVDIWRELEAGGAKVIGGKPTPTNEVTQEWTDADPIALALQPWLADADLRRRVGTAGREYVRRWLDPESVVDQYVAAYTNTQSGASNPSQGRAEGHAP